MARNLIPAIAIATSIAGAVVILNNPPINDINNDGIEDRLMTSKSPPLISLGQKDGSYHTTKILQELDPNGKRIDYFLDSEGNKWIYHGDRKLATESIN